MLTNNYSILFNHDVPLVHGFIIHDDLHTGSKKILLNKSPFNRYLYDATQQIRWIYINYYGTSPNPIMTWKGPQAGSQTCVASFIQIGFLQLKALLRDEVFRSQSNNSSPVWLLDNWTRIPPIAVFFQWSIQV